MNRKGRKIKISKGLSTIIKETSKRKKKWKTKQRKRLNNSNEQECNFREPGWSYRIKTCKWKKQPKFKKEHQGKKTILPTNNQRIIDNKKAAYKMTTLQLFHRIPPNYKRALTQLYQNNFLGRKDKKRILHFHIKTKKWIK
jgi:hypothetical protein